MKTKSIISFLLLSLVFGASFTSCEDMLMSDSDRHSYETAKDTLYNYWGILKTLQNVAERQVLLGELRGDMVMPEHVSDSLSAIAEFDNVKDGDCRYLSVRDYYAIINNCNAYLASCDTMRPIYGSTSSTTNKYMIREYAQVEAIRAWTYLQLVQLYGEVPFYLNSLTSSDAVDAFMAAPVKANRDNLYSLIGDRLQKVADVDYPEYGLYDGMAGAWFCFFPVHLVLGDIYLIADKYTEAAEQYHAFMRDNKYTKGYLPSDYQAQSMLNHDNTDVIYLYKEYESVYKAATSAKPGNNTEVITVIPSTTNKLWGNVLRGVNEAFGFTSKVLVNGSGNASTSASVTLTREHDKRQFVASAAFDRLCMDYPVIGINTKESDDNNKVYEIKTYHNTEDTVPNGQYAWTANVVYRLNGEQQSHRFIQKQNPAWTGNNFQFQTCYPIIYRKAVVWLRYAEALNRAGFPEFAYSVLHDGLHKEFMPVESDNDASYAIKAPWVTYTDTLKKSWRADKPVGVLLPYKCDTTLAEKILGTDGKMHYHYEDCRLDTNYYEIKLSTMGYSVADIEKIPEIYKSYYACDTTMVVMSRKSKNSVSSTRPLAANTHISPYEFNKAATTPYLDFSAPNFDLNNPGNRMYGVMSHGNGNAELATDVDTLVYGFHAAMKRKWKEHGWGTFKVVDKYITPSDWQLYHDRCVIAVEEIILDQMGLETCFEGHRFNDLMRVAFHRNDPSFLADKVAKRRDIKNPDANLRSKLLNKDNWFFKLPAK